MIRLIEALNYRCLRYIRQPLAPFHVLIGPNASGKTTFLDVVSFLGRLVSDGLDAALEERTSDFRELVWQKQEGPIELALEAAIPETIRERLPDKKWDTIRYEVRIGFHPETQSISILEESVLLKPWEDRPSCQRALFPLEPEPPESLMTTRIQGGRRVVSKARSGSDNFYTEAKRESGKGWFPSIRLGPKKSAFGNLPEDESKFPASTWLKNLLTTGVQSIVLNSLAMRKPSPPGQPRIFKPDGSNLPWMIEELKKDPDRFRRWIAHLRTALPELEDVRTVERPEDRHRYLVLHYPGKLEVPSWTASDGTLRLLALTLLAYLPNLQGVYLIEEPENGIHPQAVETVFQSLSSVYEAQVLLATHSPVILSLAQPEQVLCFKKTPSGATDIVLGKDHPKLRDWKKEIELGILFVSGVLG